MNGGTRAKSGAHFCVRLALCTPVYGCCVRGTQRGTQANCGNYGDVLKWLRPLKTTGLRGIRAYSTVCNSYHGGSTYWYLRRKAHGRMAQLVERMDSIPNTMIFVLEHDIEEPEAALATQVILKK